MWSTLPSNLRAVLGAALILGLGVAVAAFTLSFFALRDAASNPALKFGDGHAWLFPIGIDMALVFFEVLLIGASMVRVQERGQAVPYSRAVPFLLMLVAAAATLYFNATRVPTPARPIALAVPVASVLVTLGLAYLLKMLARVSGTDYIFEAPIESDPRKLVRSADVLQGEIVRDLDGQAPSLDGSRTGHIGQRGSGSGGGDRGATTRAIRAVLDQLDPDELTQVGDPGVADLVNAQYGLTTTPGYVNKVRRNGHKP